MQKDTTPNWSAMTDADKTTYCMRGEQQPQLWEDVRKQYGSLEQPDCEATPKKQQTATNQ
jgi:hypothetical protein